MAEERAYFEIPDDLGIKTALISAIPDDWERVTGALFAPDSLIASGRAVTTGLMTYLSDCWRFREKEDLTADPENVLQILVERKLPGFIQFNDISVSSSLPLLMIKRFAIGYLNLHYLGWMHFFRRRDGGHYPTRCELNLRPWYCPTSFREQEAGQQPARVKMAWDSQLGGTPPASLARLLETYQTLGLKQYYPVPNEMQEPATV